MAAGIKLKAPWACLASAFGCETHVLSHKKGRQECRLIDVYPTITWLL